MKLHAPKTQEEAERMITKGPSKETGWEVITEGKYHPDSQPALMDGSTQRGTALSCVLRHRLD